MPEWLWLLCLFIALTIGYIVGFTCGTWKSECELNKCPSENAYIREAEIMADTNKQIEFRKAELEYRKAELEYQMQLEILKAEQEKEKAKWTQKD